MNKLDFLSEYNSKLIEKMEKFLWVFICDLRFNFEVLYWIVYYEELKFDDEDEDEEDEDEDNEKEDDEYELLEFLDGKRFFEEDC